MGASIAINFIGNTTTARVDNSKLQSTSSTLDVKASAASTLITVAFGGAGGKTLAIGGAVSINEVKNIIEAKVTNASDLDASGNIEILAADNTSMVVVTGGIAGAGKVGIGAAVGTVQVDNQIRAYIDNSSVTSTSGFINVLSGFTPSGNPVDLSATGLTALSSAPGDATFTSNEGNQSLSTNDTVDVSAGHTAGGDVGDRYAYIGATPDQNHVLSTEDYSNTSEWRKLESTPIDISTQIINITVAGAGAGNFAAGAAISLNWLKNTVEAYIANDSTVTASGDIKVAASDDTDIISVAIGVAGAGTAAAGAAVSFNFIGGDPGDPSRTDTPVDDASPNTGVVRAYIDNSTVTSTAGAVSVLANTDARIINITVGGAGAGTVAIAGSFSINFIKTEVDAAITGDNVVDVGTTVSAGTTVNVTATAKPSMIIVAGAGSGAGSVAIGVASAVNDMRSNIKARIEGPGTTVTSNIATFTSSDGDVFLSTDDTVTVADGHTAGGIVGERYKYKGTTANQNHDLSTEVYTDTNEWTPLGADNFGKTDAPIIIDAQIWSFAVAGGGAGGVALNGSLALNWIRNDIDAHISNGALVTASSGTVTVLADDKSSMSVLAGSGGGAGTVAVGVGLAFNYIGGNPDDPLSADVNNVQAYVDNATVVANALTVQAKSDADINALVVAVSGSGVFAGNGAISLNWIRKD
ncbi:MAG: beta strand repeat-containing protein, partial [Lysobacterales bacterium]